MSHPLWMINNIITSLMPFVDIRSFKQIVKDNLDSNLLQSRIHIPLQLISSPLNTTLGKGTFFACGF